MVINGLFPVAIKTNDLDLTRRFYCDVLGLKEIARPDFGFPGAWISFSLSCSGYHEFRKRFAEMGFPYREFLVPGTTLWQLFVYDPSGVQLELTFEGAMEKGPEPDMSPGRRYVAGASFFDARSYPGLGARVSA